MTTWAHHTVSLLHPQGQTVTALVDWDTAVLTVEDPSDVQPATDWIEDRRAIHARHANRVTLGPFPDWQVHVDPTMFAAGRHPAGGAR